MGGYKFRGAIWSPKGISVTEEDLGKQGFPTDGTALVKTAYVTDKLVMLPGGLAGGLGAELELASVDSGVVELATDGAATALTLEIPAGCQPVSAHFGFKVAGADVDSDTGTLAFTGGSTATIGTVGSFTVDDDITAVLVSTAAAKTTATTNATFTLSGGSDNTPSAGSVRCIVWFLRARQITP